MSERHQFRATWHDYNSGMYFITICAFEKQHLFGSIVNNIFHPSELGEIIIEHLESLPNYYSDVELLNSVVMPNHIHFVLSVGTRFIASANDIGSNEDNESNTGCLKQPRHDEECTDFHHNSRLASIIGAFKAGVSRTARTRKIASLPVWQSRFHEHIIKNPQSFDRIIDYINNNVENWQTDCFAN